jgi:hypothetical protein
LIQNLVILAFRRVNSRVPNQNAAAPLAMREVKRRERRAPIYLPRLACRAVALAKAGSSRRNAVKADAQIFFQKACRAEA